VEVVQLQVKERIVEVPLRFREERPVEKPVVQHCDVYTEVAKPSVQYQDKQVPKFETRCIDRVEEVLQHLYEEHTVEVPQIQQVEVIKQQLQPHVQRVMKKVPKTHMQYVEKLVEVSSQMNPEGNFGSPPRRVERNIGYGRFKIPPQCDSGGPMGPVSYNAPPACSSGSVCGGCFMDGPPPPLNNQRFEAFSSWAPPPRSLSPVPGWREGMSFSPGPSWRDGACVGCASSRSLSPMPRNGPNCFAGDMSMPPRSLSPLPSRGFDPGWRYDREIGESRRYFGPPRGLTMPNLQEPLPLWPSPPPFFAVT